MIDAGPIGNFGRFINHQDTPNAEAQSVVIDKNLAIKKGVVDEEYIEVIKDIEFLEVMELYVLEDIHPGQEIFTDYGTGYWAEKKHFKVRQESFYMHSKSLDDLVVKNGELKSEVDDWDGLKRQEKFLEEKFSWLKKVLQVEFEKIAKRGMK